MFIEIIYTMVNGNVVAMCEVTTNSIDSHTQFAADMA